MRCSEGSEARTGTYSRGGQMGEGYGDQRHLGYDARYRLVCTATGLLQAESECAMAAEILPGKTILEALNTDLVCDAINTAMRELFLQIVYGRTQSAFSEGGLTIGAGLEDLGKGLVSQCGTLYSTKAKGVRYLQLTEGYITKEFLDEDNEVCGYEYVHMGKFMDAVKKGVPADEALKSVTGTYGRTTKEQGAVKSIDPRKN